MIVRISCFLALACFALLGADPVAARLAHEADRARASGRYVKAYLLYSEAAARDSSNPTYAANRDALAPSAKLLTKADVESANIATDIKAAEQQGSASPGASQTEPPVELANQKAWESIDTLRSIPKLTPSAARLSFNLRGNERTLFEQVATAYGIRVTFDPALEPKSSLRFEIDDADFRTAMEALTAVTGTFLFPISEKAIFVAADTESKRQEFEPEILLTFPLPNANDQKDLIEAANAVRSVLGSRAVGWDSISRVVMIRDRVTRARTAYALLEALLLPKAQVSFEVQILALDTERNYHYGLALPTAFQFSVFSQIGGFKTLVPAFSTAASFVTFGGASAIFGVGLGDATFFATYTKSSSHLIYDATVVVSDGQTANFHVGDQYPIQQAQYNGPTQGLGSLAAAVGQVNYVNLGLILKLTPRVNGDGEVAINVEAAYKALGSESFNNIPAVLEREFKGSVMVHEDQLAVLAGLDSSNFSIGRNGLIGLSQIPGLNQVLSENTRDEQTSQTLLLVKPTVTRLPMSNAISPQYLLGPARGQRVVL